MPITSYRINNHRSPCKSGIINCHQLLIIILKAHSISCMVLKMIINQSFRRVEMKSMPRSGISNRWWTSIGRTRTKRSEGGMGWDHQGRRWVRPGFSIEVISSHIWRQFKGLMASKKINWAAFWSKKNKLLAHKVSWWSIGSVRNRRRQWIWILTKCIRISWIKKHGISCKFGIRRLCCRSIIIL